MTPASAPLIAVARAIGVTSGAAAMRRAWPLALALLVVGAVLFGPNGLSSRDLTAPTRSSGALRLALWTAWMVASLPVARSLLRDRSLRVVLAQPVSRSTLAAVLSAALCLAHAPWIAFRARGEGALDALASALASVVGSWGLASPPRGRVRRSLSSLLALTLVATPDPWTLALVSLALGALIILAAMATLGTPTIFTVASRSLPRSPAGALIAAHWRLLARTASTALARQLALVCAGAALAIPTLHNNAQATGEERVRLALACVTLPLATFATSLATVFDANDRALRSTLVNAGVSASTRTLVTLATVAAPTAAIAWAAVTAASVLARAPGAWEIGAAAALWSAGLAVTALRCVRGSTGADVLRSAGRMALAVAMSFALLLSAGPWALIAPVCAIAVVAHRERKDALQ